MGDYMGGRSHRCTCSHRRLPWTSRLANSHVITCRRLRFRISGTASHARRVSFARAGCQDVRRRLETHWLTVNGKDTGRTYCIRVIYCEKTTKPLIAIVSGFLCSCESINRLIERTKKGKSTREYAFHISIFIVRLTADKSSTGDR